ncbi:MAG TPA: hypothetical protein PK002_08015 [Cellvibrio sp.]|nr:hypothetical protein [Cellvibrio sp.]
MATLNRNQFPNCSTETELSLNIRNHKNTPLPPIISAQAFNKNGGFDPETVISRNPDGTIASRFKDLSWGFSALTTVLNRGSQMYFNYDEELANEAKTIVLLFMLAPVKTCRSLDRYLEFYYLIKYVADLCNAEKTTLKNLFNSNGGVRLVKIIKDEAPFLCNRLVIISEYLNFMLKVVGFEHGFKPLKKNAVSQLRKAHQTYKEEINQTPVIPSQLLKSICIDTISEYESLQPILNELLEMQSEIDSHPLVGIALSNQKSSSKKYCGKKFSLIKGTYPTNDDLGRKYPLARDYLNKHFGKFKNKSHGEMDDFDVHYARNDVLKAINYIQRVCQDMIIMFTGMRPAEARLLPYFGSKETVVDGVYYWLIYGFAVKKRSNTYPFEMWVTNKYGYSAFQTAKRIADLYYKRNQRKPVEALPDNGLTPELSPLFLRDDGEIDKRQSSVKQTPALANSYLISQADANELKMIDPHRIWDGSPEFAVGKAFPVVLRQFRRSVAFFASASGVRLVDLKNQLHHLFESQTFYYANGSGRANPFLKSNDSFASYFNQVKHEAEAFSFINEVINFDGMLFGASAGYAERNQVFYSTIRDEERTETVKRFKRGELAYTETLLGSCKTLEPCKSKALGSLTACLSCKDADIKPLKLANAIRDQVQLVERLNPDRLEFRTEIEELIIMLDFAIKNIGNAMEKMDRRKVEYKQFSQWSKEFKQTKKNYLKKIDEHGEAG